jgi:hypothetical protein
MSCGLVKAQPQRLELTYITVLIREDAEVRYGESPHPKTSTYLHRGAIITPLKRVYSKKLLHHRSVLQDLIVGCLRQIKRSSVFVPSRVKPSSDGFGNPIVLGKQNVVQRREDTE